MTTLETKKDLVENIVSKIMDYTGYVMIHDKFKRQIYRYIMQFDFMTVAYATEIAFEKYFNPFGEPWEEWDSFLNAMQKIGGICYNMTYPGGKT